MHNGDDDEDVEYLAQLADDMVDKACVLFAGKPPQVVGLVLAELLAMWVAYHLVISDDPKDQREVWDEMLQMHLEKVKELIELIVAEP